MLNITSMFSRHTLSAEDAEKSDRVRQHFQFLAWQVEALTPPGPNQTLALRHLEDALMRCNKALCEDKPLVVPDCQFGSNTSADKIGKVFAPKGNGPTLQDPAELMIPVARDKFEELLNRKITVEQLEELYAKSKTCFDGGNHIFWMNFTSRINAFFRGDKA